MKVTEATLELLRTAGFGPQDATAIAQAALWTGLALVMSEPGIELRDGVEREEAQRVRQVHLATPSRARCPRLVGCAIPMTACDDPEMHYEFGVELFTAGVSAIAASRWQASSSRPFRPACRRPKRSRHLTCSAAAPSPRRTRRRSARRATRRVKS